MFEAVPNDLRTGCETQITIAIIYLSKLYLFRRMSDEHRKHRYLRQTVGNRERETFSMS